MRSWPIAVVALLLAACGEQRTPPPATVGQPVTTHDEWLLDENHRLAEREERDIQKWIERWGADMVSTGTGLRYKLLRDVPGDTAKPGQVALVNYAVLLLNGDTAYVSDPAKPDFFRIEQADVESGLHEGIQHLSVGDSAVLVIPSILAFGLLGDLDQIPMRSTVVYHIALVDLRE